ncbi:MAG: hypothetical protein IJB97_05150 [Clostridia bacterium]|nr:hypothetical protein [Clostridia bacterium]
MRNVAVLFGGKSCENEISVLTGLFVINVLDKRKYDVLPVYLHTDGLAYTSGKLTDLETFKRKEFSSLKRVVFDDGNAYLFSSPKRKLKRLGKVDVALNCCHGGLGEGGGVAALMEMHKIPLASPKLTASGVFLDKILTKFIAKGLGIPTVDYVAIGEEEFEKRGAFLMKTVAAKLQYPVIGKPATLGSSIGIAVAENETELKDRLKTAFALDDRAIVEKFLKGKKDVNCAAYRLNGEICVSEPEEAASGDGVYGFEEKYLKRNDGGRALTNGVLGGASGGNSASNSAGKLCAKKPLVGEIREKIRAFTRTVYRRMNLQGVVRIDFLVVGEKAYLSEVNTVPGSLAYYLFCERLMDARAFFSDLLEEAIKTELGGEKKLVTTGILTAVDWKRK